MASEQIGSASIKLVVDSSAVAPALEEVKQQVERATAEVSQGAAQATTSTTEAATKTVTETAQAAVEAVHQVNAEVEKTPAATQAAATATETLADKIQTGFTGARGAIMGVVRVLGTFGAAVGVLALVRDAIDQLTDSSGKAARSAAEARNEISRIIPDESFSKSLERFDEGTARVLKQYAELKARILETAQQQARAGKLTNEQAVIFSKQQVEALGYWRDRELAANNAASAEKNVAEQQRASSSLSELASQYAKERMSDEEQINAEYDDRIKLIEKEADALQRAGGLPEYVQALRNRAAAEADSARRSQLSRIEAEKRAAAEQESARAMEQQTRESERRAQVESQARAQAQRDQMLANALERQAVALDKVLQAIQLQTEITKSLRRVL